MKYKVPSNNSNCTIHDHPSKSDFENLLSWAKKADWRSWKKDPVGKVKGVGLNTFQYLRMQVGVDTSMPDRIIWRYVEKKLGKSLKDKSKNKGIRKSSG